MRSEDPTDPRSTSREPIIIRVFNTTRNPNPQFSMFVWKFKWGSIKTSTTHMSAPERCNRKAFKLLLMKTWLSTARSQGNITPCAFSLGQTACTLATVTHGYASGWELASVWPDHIERKIRKHPVRSIEFMNYEL